MRNNLAIKESCSRPCWGLISPPTLRSVVPKGMQGLLRKLRLFNGRRVQSLPPVKEHFLVENTNRLKELELDIKCSFSGRPFLEK